MVFTAIVKNQFGQEIKRFSLDAETPAEALELAWDSIQGSKGRLSVRLFRDGKQVKIS